MELYPAEVASLKSILGEWITQDKYEVEASFGVGGVVDATAFLNVAQRLKAKGWRELPQEDYMNIITPENVRFTLTSMRAIQQYCRDDLLEGKPFVAMKKDRAVNSQSNLDLADYDVRVKVRREILLNANDPVVTDQISRWVSQKKAFRLLRRWTFQGTGIRVDMSIVRSSPKGAKGGFLWQNRFLERDITKEPPAYEIEVELLRDGLSEDPAVAQEEARKNLIRGVGEILRGLQKHSILMRNSSKRKVLGDYEKLTGIKEFRGVAPITLMYKNMAKGFEADPEVRKKTREYNIRTGYNVTDKADGLRVHAFTGETGELFLIDMSMNIYRTGLVNAAAKNALMDGEWVTKDKENRSIQQVLLFDAYFYEGKDVTQLPFEGDDLEKKENSRYGALKGWVDTWNAGDGPRSAIVLTEATKILVAAKEYKFAVAGDLSIFREAARVLDTPRLYYTDGLIFTPNKSPIPDRAGVGWFEQLKWKPAHDNSVDFLVKFEKDPENPRVEKVNFGVKEETGERLQYKTLRLYVGSSKDAAFENPRGTILFEQALPDMRGQDPRRGARGGRREYKPVLFNPGVYADTMANTCYRAIHINEETGEEYVKCDRDGDPIQDNSIVEMMYEPEAEPGWRWVPIRVRYDKTERFQRGIAGRTMNKDDSAESVWESIHKPVTLSMIRSGAEEPNAQEVSARILKTSGEVGKVYYARKAPKNDIQLISGLRDFHNEWVKEGILLGTGLKGGGKTLLDMACGQGGDIFKWMREKVRFVLGVDIAGFGITDPQNGAYRRYMNAWLKNGRENVPTMVFAIGSSARNLSSGDAGATPEESNILRSVLGHVAPDGPVPPYVEKYCAGALRPGADCVALMFALHYFFESEDSLRNIIRNIHENLKQGGLFIGCCFDGQKVFDALRYIPEGGSLTGMDNGAEIWKITKRYSATDFVKGPESLGLPIDVQFVSIGTEQREYLMNFELFKQKMEEIGCELMTDAECREVGLTHSTAMFEDSYAMAKQRRKDYPMSAKIKEFSFFNRWFIFKRRRVDVLSETELKEAAGVPVVEGEEGNVTPAYAEVTPPEIIAERMAQYARENAERAAGVAGGPVAGAAAPPPVAAAPPAPPTAAPAAAAAATDVRTVRMAAPAAAAAEEAAGGAGGGGGAGSAAAEAARAAMRTLPTEAPAVAKRAYSTTELYQFYYDAAKVDRLKIGDPTAARWLDPSAPFPIVDTETGVKYPSLEHFIAAMKYKLASNKPELGASIFSEDGTIHREFNRKRQTETAQGTRALTEARDHDLLKEERADVINKSKPMEFKKYRAVFDEAMWSTKKDGVLEEGLRQRWEKDARLRRVVEAARNAGLVLLYYTGNVSGSNLGGVRRAPEGYIDGENKVGTILMRLAGFKGA